jgi:hypothetical protein
MPATKAPHAARSPRLHSTYLPRRHSMTDQPRRRRAAAAPPRLCSVYVPRCLRLEEAHSE